MRSLFKELAMMLKNLYLQYSRLSKNLQSFALLVARLVVAYGFYEPAMRKWSDMQGIAQWFASLGIPLPTLNAYMAATTEITGVVLLTLGLFTRVISIPLIVVMIVAIVTVHLHNGFSCGNNGFEIPLYYMIFLLIFISHGAGRFSLDRVIFGDKN